MAPESKKLIDANALLEQVLSFAKEGNLHEVVALTGSLDDLPPEPRVRLLIARGNALYHQGNVVDSIEALSLALSLSGDCTVERRFRATLALFDRKVVFLPPDDALREISKLRQVASSIGDAPALAALHHAVARLEAC